MSGVPAARRPPQVAILEDDATIVAVVRKALEGAGMAVRSAGRLEELETLWKPGAPDLFLLDVNLPDGSGFEACRRLRQLPATEHAPIIFLTGRNEVENRLRAFSLGAQDYVIKPFSVEELLVRVQAHLRLKIQRDQKDSALAELALRERLHIDLMDMVIHDIRTPLGTVQMAMSILAQDGTISEKQHEEMLAVAARAADTALLMLNDLLDLRAGRVASEPAPFALDQPLRRAAAVLGPLAAKHGIAISVDSSPKGARVVSDEKMLLRVILNLLGNAIKFTPDASAVELSLRHDGSCLRLEVADRGLGVPAADKERIFEKFARAGEAALSAPGTGIGLSFCRLAAETLGGRVWTEDRPGGGSLFIFEVPARADSSANEAAELLGPEVMKEYRDDCEVQLAALESALAGAPLPGPELLESVRLTAHRLSGSAGTYGYAEAGRAAKRLERRVLDSKKENPGLCPRAEEILLAVRDIRRGLDL